MEENNYRLDKTAFKAMTAKKQMTMLLTGIIKLNQKN